MTIARLTAIRPILERPDGQADSLTRTLAGRHENHLREQGLVTFVQMNRKYLWPWGHRIHIEVIETPSLDLEHALAVRTFQDDFDRILQPLGVEEQQ